jgi:hypothetical protein
MQANARPDYKVLAGSTPAFPQPLGFEGSGKKIGWEHLVYLSVAGWKVRGECRRNYI